MVKLLKKVQNQLNPKMELVNYIIPGQGIKLILFIISVGKLGILLYAIGHLTICSVIVVIILLLSIEKVGVV